MREIRFLCKELSAQRLLLLTSGSGECCIIYIYYIIIHEIIIMYNNITSYNLYYLLYNFEKKFLPSSANHPVYLEDAKKTL